MRLLYSKSFRKVTVFLAAAGPARAPLRQPKTIGTKGNTVRHDYCAILRPLQSGVWVVSTIRTPETFAWAWATCRSGADLPYRLQSRSIIRAEQYCGRGR